MPRRVLTCARTCCCSKSQCAFSVLIKVRASQADIQPHKLKHSKYHGATSIIADLVSHHRTALGHDAPCPQNHKPAPQPFAPPSRLLCDEFDLLCTCSCGRGMASCETTGHITPHLLTSSAHTSLSPTSSLMPKRNIVAMRHHVFPTKCRGLAVQLQPVPPSSCIQDRALLLL